MTTPLRKPLARTLALDHVPYKVILSPEGVQIMRKGRRKGPIVGWDAILRLCEEDGEEIPVPTPAADPLPDSIAREVALELLTAESALARAGAKLEAAKELPPELRMHMDPDPVYGRQEQRTDWFVEPLLTPPEVASLLRVSKATVARLPIPWISIAGERRYRQSQIRQYLTREETEGGYLRGGDRRSSSVSPRR